MMIILIINLDDDLFRCEYLIYFMFISEKKLYKIYIICIGWEGLYMCFKVGLIEKVVDYIFFYNYMNISKWYI